MELCVLCLALFIHSKKSTHNVNKPLKVLMFLMISVTALDAASAAVCWTQANSDLNSLNLPDGGLFYKPVATLQWVAFGCDVLTLIFTVLWEIFVGDDSVD